jgi:UDP-N-acetylglucosamine/UDP-N-acetylgalactosamine diphosphorylase
VTAAESLVHRYRRARQVLEAVGQAQVLHFWEQLDDARRARLLDQIDSVDWPEIARLVESHVRQTPRFELPHGLRPAPWYPHSPSGELVARYAAAREMGIELIRQNKVAAFTVAGGQGTRLGWDAPKGTFPATSVRGLSLFGCLAEYLRKTQEKYRAVVPWYIMTSPANDAPTRAFFNEHRHFGLSPANVMFFPQAMMPALGLHGENLGKVLLEAPESMALSPNGHGGSLKALYSSGAIADMKKRGIEQVCYTQVDNPLVRVVDPLFIGLHAGDGCAMSSKMLPKREPLEKLGNFCLVDGRVMVIEYSDLPEELAYQTLPDGQLRFRAGSIAIHLLRVDFVETLNRGGNFSLPFHRAEKKVPCVDLKTGQVVRPHKSNAVKLETFVFDALPLGDKSIIYETDRIDEFAPIKNADAPPGAGALDQPAALDSPRSSKDLQVQRAARWLEAQGVKVPRRADGTVAAVIEISQLTAIEPDDLHGVRLPAEVKPDSQLLL